MEFVILLVFIIAIYFFVSDKRSSGAKSSRQSKFTYNESPETRIARERQRILREQEVRKRRLEESERIEQLRREELERQRRAELQRQQDAARLNAIRQAQEQARLARRIASYKSNWNVFQEVLQRNNITKLYHFTDRTNLNSIRQNGGLLSWYYCEQNNISIPKPGGSSTSRDLDQRKGLQNYVRVSFVRDHPMMFVAQNDGRISNPIILEISPDVVYLKNSKYACQNAAKSGVNSDGTIEKFNSIKFQLFKQRYFDISDEEKSYYQAEVLVYEKLPIEYITNINNF